jgi:HEAT repeat protein
MPVGDEAAARVPVLVERFVRQLNVALRAVKLYPPSGAIPQEAATAALDALHAVMETEPVVEFAVSKDSLYYGEAAVLADNPAFVSFARDFYNRQVADVRLHAGLTPDELLRFLVVLGEAPEDVAAAGGFEALLWERGVSGVSVTEVSTRIVEVGGVPPAGAAEEGISKVHDTDAEPWPPHSGRIVEIVESAYSGRPRDQRLLVRIVREPGVVAQYLRESRAGRGDVPDDMDLAGRIAALAHSAQFELPEDQEAIFRALSQAVMSLEPEQRATVLSDKLLDEVRHDDSVASVVRQLGLDELFNALLREVEETDDARIGLTRAIRNLALINLASREEMVEATRVAMIGRGFSAAFTESVADGVSPSQLTVRERPRNEKDRPVETIIRLIDLAAGDTGAPIPYDAAVQALREEASRGMGDGDVLAALVTLATLEGRSEKFSSVMSLVEDNLGLLIDQGAFESAADAAEALTGAEQVASLDPQQLKRLGAAVRVMASPASLRSITSSLRLYRHDSPEFLACRRLLATLGEYSLSPLLEVLADEPDMAARKSMVDLISAMAVNYVDELGERLSDGRWYFVRNVVSIMGSTRDPRVLPHLRRTLRHHDERVRRETIRALSSVKDRVAEEMLVAALSDDDAQNVGLAARYLGIAGSVRSVTRLEELARGTGRWGRDNGPRIEAIEALGRIGAASSEDVLRAITKHRRLIGGTRAREVRTAAESALHRLKLGKREVAE